MGSSVSSLSPIETNWKWTQALLEKRAHSNSTVQKICLFIANFFFVAAEGIRNSIQSIFKGNCSSISATKIESDLEKPSIKEQFSKLYAWESFFEKAPVVKSISWQNVFSLTPYDSELDDAAFRLCRTDGEPDDLMYFMEKIFALHTYIYNTGHVPKISVIVSEGDSELLDRKIETFQILMCSMVDQGLVDEGVLNAFQFFKEKDQKIDDEKAQGFMNLYNAADRILKKGEVEKLMSGFKPPQPVENLYRQIHTDQITKFPPAVNPVIREIVIAPINGFVEHYAQRQKDLPFVVEEGYGSFNLNQGIERLQTAPGPLSNEMTTQADRVVNMLAHCKHVFNFEAFPATIMTVESNGTIDQGSDGRPVYEDFNRIGPVSDPEIFAPLRENPSPLQQFVLAMMKGWSEPVGVKMTSGIRAMKGGPEFLKEFLNRKMTLHEALKLCRTHIDPSAVKKAEVKVKVLHNIIMNDGLQGTLSDFTYALIKSDPSLVRDECLFKAKVGFQDSGGRMNTVFRREEQGNAFAVESDVEGRQTGLDIPRVRGAIIAFFNRLKPQAGPLA